MSIVGRFTRPLVALVLAAASLPALAVAPLLVPGCGAGLPISY